MDTSPADTPPAASTLIMAVGVTVGAALAGGWLMNFLATAIGLYVPFIPGAVVGYAVARCCRSNLTLVAVIAAIGGFAGMVFGDALTYDLPNHPGVWNYITHFWEAATPIKILFWLANVVIAFWTARVAPATSSGFPVTTVGAPCPSCGAANTPHAAYCSACGKRIPR